jgi:3-deoxy-manno-octulosonate cytidylyltransferase (CMP-KDO synthetase)
VKEGGMQPLVIIPARYGSSRLNGKPLLKLAGKPLIQHTIEAAKRTGWQVIVATDHSEIYELAKRSATHAVMTGECANGTERCAWAAKVLGWTGPVINWQGDSPLVPADWVKDLYDAVIDGADVATPVQLCTSRQAAQIRRDAMRGVAGATTVAMRPDSCAHYFSKSPIPFAGALWLHVGVYAYSAEALDGYGRTPSPNEKAEGLEQLRLLDNRIEIQCVPVVGSPIWEVNNFEDLAIVERLMGERDATVGS